MGLYYRSNGVSVYRGDRLAVLAQLPRGAAQTCVTSPPYYGLRDYGCEGQLGMEAKPDEYVNALVETFRAVRRVLADDGTVWLNLGDTFWTAKGAPGGAGAGHPDAKSKSRRFGCRPQDRPPPPGVKAKDLLGVPWRVALALQQDGWWLRGDVVWEKPNAMPEPTAHDRPSRTHEYLFLLAKSRRYYCDGAPLKSSVWRVRTRPSSGTHPAPFPAALVRPCVRRSSRPGDVVLDPFCGTGTTGLVALSLGRRFVGIDLNADYVAVAARRLAETGAVRNSASVWSDRAALSP